MSTRKRGKKGRQKSKAAMETERRKNKSRGGSSTLETSPRTGGMMTKMRGGFQNAVGSDESQKGSFLGKILWTLVLAAAVFFFARGM